MMQKLNTAILISGRGSNMGSLIQASLDLDYPARIVTVVSNRKEAAGRAKAEKAGIPEICLAPKDFSCAKEFEDSLHNHLIKNEIQLVCLAGFMRILSADFVKNWTDRILNIHPSLLPDYPGLDPQGRALADGRTETGCTVHVVTAQMDAGPIILQRRVPIHLGDTLSLIHI